MGWNILIVGAGAIGCLVGGKLAQAGQQVTLVGRPAFVEQVRGHGLQLADAQGSQRIRSLRVAADLLEAYERSPSAFDLAIFTVKCYDTAAAVDELRQALAATGAPPPALLSVQNGIGNEALLGQLVPTAPVLAGSLTTPVSVVAPGSIRVDKPSYGLGLAVWRGSQADAQAVGSLLAQAGFVVTSYADAAALKWTKLLMNLLGNATSAILDEPPQQIFADRRMVDLEIAAWREALAVMRASHIAPVNLERYPFARLAPLIRWTPKGLLRLFLRRQIGAARGGKLPSLHLDLHHKSKSEVAWLNGAVVAAGQQTGVPTPTNAALTSIVLRLCQHPEERASWRGAYARLWEAAAWSSQKHQS